MMVHIGFGLHTSILPWCTSGLVYIPVSYHGILGVVYIPSSYHGALGVVYILISYHGTLDLVYVPELHMMVHSGFGLYTSLLHTGSGQQSHSFTTIPIRFSLHQPMPVLHYGMVHVILLTAHDTGSLHIRVSYNATLWYGTLCDVVDSP